MTIPVLRPRLPSADRLRPYLEQIDEARFYTNWGPLSAGLERRLSIHFRVPDGSVTSASSGTAALTGAVLAAAGRAGRQKPLALLPSFTFVATAVAAEQCGYRPLLADIDPETWTLDPQRLESHPALHDVGVAVPVAPFGRAVEQGPWREFQQRTGIPVVIDGAASFDRLGASHIGEIPVALSFHATKSFATGEGGCVISRDQAVLSRVTRALNFGFHIRRESEAASINGKMSEYHAAVGLAELDGWPQKLQDFMAVADGYQQAASVHELEGRMWTAPEFGASYVLLEAANAGAAREIAGKLSSAGIGHRLWYGYGLHRDAYFLGSAREELPVTDDVAPRLLGLPVAPDLPASDIAEVVSAIGR